MSGAVGLRPGELSRRFIVDVAKDGEVTIREKGTPIDEGLPVFSVDARDDAQTLIERHCRRARDGSGRYYLTSWPSEREATLEDLDSATKLFRDSHVVLDDARASMAAYELGIERSAQAYQLVVDERSRHERIGVTRIAPAAYAQAIGLAYLAAPHGTDEESELERALGAACDRLGLEVVDVLGELKEQHGLVEVEDVR